MTSATITLVDFYVLESKSQNSIWTFCCRLTEKVWAMGNTVHILTNNEQETQLVDELLWTFNQQSFVPHATQGENLNVPVTITHESVDDSADLLINLASTSPGSIDNYPRIAEILIDDEDIKSSGRKRYSAYKQAGCQLQHHNIESK